MLFTHNVIAVVNRFESLNTHHYLAQWKIPTIGQLKNNLYADIISRSLSRTRVSEGYPTSQPPFDSIMKIDMINYEKEHIGIVDK